jgi:hypothetical protein
MEIHTPQPNPFEVETAIAKLKKYKLPGTDQILAKIIQAGDEMLCSEIHKPLLHYQWKKSITLPIYKKCHEIDCHNYRDIIVINMIQNFIQYPFLKVKFIHRKNYSRSSL